MKERLQLRRRIEVTRLAPEVDIGEQKRLRDQRLAEFLEFGREKEEPSGHDASQRDDGERGENSADASLPKCGESKLPPFEIAQDECRYQIARDDEEDIDAQIAAVEAELRVKQNDSEDRYSAKAVDL